MAIVSVGYDGPIDEVGFSRMAPSVGSSEYGVLAGWNLTPHPTTAQAVNLSDGQGWGWGVYDKSDSTETVQCDPITSGTRWDLIGMDRDWQVSGGLSKFAAVAGGLTKALPTRQQNPGVRDVQPLWLVQWTAGQTQPTAIVDLRIWAGNGGMFALDDLVRTFINRVGSTVNINGVEWALQIGSNGGIGWVRRTDNTIVYEGFVNLGPTNVNGDGTFNFSPAFPNGIKSIQITDNNPVYSFLGAVHIKIHPGSVTRERFNFKAYSGKDIIPNAGGLLVCITARGW